MPSPVLHVLLNGTPVEVRDVAPQTTLLQWLREDRQLTGTKEGCAEGDCGACTVVIAEREGEGLAFKPINACIRPLPSVAGKAIFTVESLKAADGTLHPVQQALVDCHGSQCGFCTPGFVMSLFGLYKENRTPSREDVDNAISGNLCRCTGYRPILLAGQKMVTLPAPDDWRGPGRDACGNRIVSDDEARLAHALDALPHVDDYEAAGQRWLAPTTTAALADACVAHQDARLVAGATDVGLWITKEHRDLGTMISTLAAKDFARVDVGAASIDIGAGASLVDVFAVLDAEYPELAEAWVRFASIPIRHSATLGGNVANGSPIGDSMPALIALDATVELRHGDDRRALPVEDFYLGYRTTALQRGELLTRIRVPRRTHNLTLRAWKISKRFDQDISAVFACFALHLRGGNVVDARIGCGGVAPIPMRARKTERELIGRAWDQATAESAATTLAGEFQPIDDMRASAGYRRRVLGNLVRRLWHETSSARPPTTRVTSAASMSNTPA
ncbi:MAG TPA: xanthine dehydrogenase small subunit [Casimicrobiaceae bacterium]|nr:xanthine dehydrogenase small subunit [Casimicrobiaceae bacterium]